jgi:hypothetical protein
MMIISFVYYRMIAHVRQITIGNLFSTNMTYRCRVAADILMINKSERCYYEYI